MTEPTPAPCAAVLRASEGPCETCQSEVPSEGRSEEWLEHYTGALCASHPYLPPKIGVCGHPLSAHGEAPEPNEPPFRMPWCVDCEQSGDAAMYANGAHAFKAGEEADA